MGWKEYGKGRKYHNGNTLSALNPGTTLVTGRYTGTVEGKYGPQHIVEDDEGFQHYLGNWGQLRFKLESITPGTRIMIVYQGKIVLTSGKMAGKESHQFQLFVDEDGEGMAETMGGGSDDDEDDVPFF